MATLKPLYGPKTSVSISLNSLPSGNVATSSTIDNSSNLYQDFLIEVTISGASGSNAWLEVRILPSEDGSNFATWDNGITIGTIDMVHNSETAHFNLLGNLFQAPKYFKIAIKNNTGYDLSSSGNSVSYQGINIQS